MSYPAYVYHKVMNEEKGYREKKRCEYLSPVIDKEGKFLTGFIPRMQKFCQDSGIPLDIKDNTNYPEWYKRFPDLPLFLKQEKKAKLESGGIKLRPDQIEMIRIANIEGRGVIHAPTAAGKTIIMLAILLYHHDLNALIITSNTDLVRQGVKDFEPFFEKGAIGWITGNEVEPSRITFSNIQKLHKIPISNWHKTLDIVLVDECHHVNSFKGTYAKVLQSIPAPMRFGVTATLPYTPEGIMSLEGLIGPTIGEVKMETLMAQGVLAKPKLKILKAPYNHKIHELEAYTDVYEKGVVQNRVRNRMLLQETQQLVNDGLTILILVSRIEHGENLERMAQVMFPDIKLKWIHGITDKEARSEVQRVLQYKEVDVVVASYIWREGMNIPSLGAVINAAGGKEPIFPAQAMGRGLRTAPGKTEVILVDFFDPSHRYLIDHFGHRLCLYSDLGWL